MSIPTRSISIGNMGNLLYMQGKYDEAMVYYHERPWKLVAASWATSIPTRSGRSATWAGLL